MDRDGDRRRTTTDGRRKDREIFLGKYCCRWQLQQFFFNQNEECCTHSTTQQWDVEFSVADTELAFQKPGGGRSRQSSYSAAELSLAFLVYVGLLSKLELAIVVHTFSGFRGVQGRWAAYIEKAPTCTSTIRVTTMVNVLKKRNTEIFLHESTVQKKN